MILTDFVPLDLKILPGPEVTWQKISYKRPAQIATESAAGDTVRACKQASRK
jgi:hypothetical protein